MIAPRGAGGDGSVWDTLVPLFTTGGIVGVVATVFYRLHKSAIGAERRRADDWREAYRAERARADLKEKQIGILLGRVRDDGPAVGG